MRPVFETVHADADSSLRCLHFSCNQFSDNHTWHYHPEYELAYVVASSGTRFVGDSIKTYEPGDLVLIGPNLPHCWSDHRSADTRATPPELLVIQFTPTSFGEGFLSLGETAPIKRLLALADTGLHFTGDVARQAGDRMRAAIEERGLNRLLLTIDTLNIMARAQGIRPLATRQYCSSMDIDPLNRSRIESAHRYIRENLAGTISQAAVAAALGLRPSAFSRFFKTATGRTFVTFVNTLRINEACRRLHESSCSITEIAMCCGYNNISNFNRQFLAQRGMSPSDYRQRALRRTEHHLRYIHTHPVTSASASR